MANMQEFMSETKEINRWFITAVFVAGAFAGALLAVAFSILGFIR